MTPRYYTLAEAAVPARCSVQTLRAYIRDGILPAVRRAGRGPWLISEDALRALLRVEPSPGGPAADDADE